MQMNRWLPYIALQLLVAGALAMPQNILVDLDEDSDLEEDSSTLGDIDIESLFDEVIADFEELQSDNVEALEFVTENEDFEADENTEGIISKREVSATSITPIPDHNKHMVLKLVQVLSTIKSKLDAEKRSSSGSYQPTKQAVQTVSATKKPSLVATSTSRVSSPIPDKVKALYLLSWLSKMKQPTVAVPVVEKEVKTTPVDNTLLREQMARFLSQSSSKTPAVAVPVVEKEVKTTPVDNTLLKEQMARFLTQSSSKTPTVAVEKEDNSDTTNERTKYLQSYLEAMRGSGAATTDAHSYYSKLRANIIEYLSKMFNHSQQYYITTVARGEENKEDAKEQDGENYFQQFVAAMAGVNNNVRGDVKTTTTVKVESPIIKQEPDIESEEVVKPLARFLSVMRMVSSIKNDGKQPASTTKEGILEIIRKRIEQENRRQVTLIEKLKKLRSLIAGNECFKLTQN